MGRAKETIKQDKDGCAGWWRHYYQATFEVTLYDALGAPLGGMLG
jgi:hypothetical protein